jgi:2-keto-4-pentenoate hydratase
MLVSKGQTQWKRSSRRPNIWRNCATPAVSARAFPKPFRPASIDDALKIQERLVRNLGDAIGGYKCSVPTAARAAVLAPILAPTIRSTVPFPVRPAAPSATSVARIEPEVAFVLARSLPPRAEPYSEADVRGRDRRNAAGARSARLALHDRGRAAVRRAAR